MKIKRMYKQLADAMGRPRDRLSVGGTTQQPSWLPFRLLVGGKVDERLNPAGNDDGEDGSTGN